MDVLASLGLMAAGATSLLIHGAQTADYEELKAFHDQHFSDPFFSGTEPQPPGNGAVFAGVALIAAGAVWGLASLLVLPTGPQPPLAVSKDRFTLQRNVASTGCSPEGGVAPEAGRSPAAQKLEELKRLRDQGLLTEEEYERKRRAAVEGL